ncbi:MAG: hypothetical protein ACRD0K_03855 [Egibacteraceae bacterium]
MRINTTGALAERDVRRAITLAVDYQLTDDVTSGEGQPATRGLEDRKTLRVSQVPADGARRVAGHVGLDLCWIRDVYVAYPAHNCGQLRAL